ncbi:hypothetical protein BHE74_00044246 [Ensete ventricosum]|nr:hypothetical protein BHE74_00044246 [Ensete ventricosum]
MRCCLVLMLEDEVAPRLPCAGTRRCLVHPLEDEVSPRLTSLGRGAASFFCWKARWDEASPRLPVLWRLVFQRWDEVMPCSYVGRRGGALYSCAGTRLRLVHPLEDEATFAGMRRCLVLLLESEAGMRHRLVFLHCDEARTRCCLVFLRYDETASRSPAGRRGVASASFIGTRRCLVLLLEGKALPRHFVFLRWDEALPCSSVGRRGGALSSNVGTRCYLVLTLEDEASPRLPSLG